MGTKSLNRLQLTKTGLAIGSVIALTTGLAACSGGGSTTSDGATNSNPAITSTECGVVPELPANDPDGLLSQFSEDIQANYNGFANPVLPSHWADWAPDHDGPYTAALVTNPRNNPFQIGLQEGAEAALQEAGIEILASLAAPSEVDVATQAQQFQQALGLNPDIILLGALAPEPAIELVEAAAEAGIPVVSMHLATNSDKAVSVSFNNTLEAMTTGSGVVNAIGGEGTILRVHGIPGIAQDAEATAGFDAVLASCPDVKQVAEITGMYQTAETQKAVVEFLATNPAGVDGVLQSGVMGLGVLQGFDQAGQTLTALTDGGATRGSIAIAKATPDLQFFATGQPAFEMGQRYGQIAERILAGQGPKINQFVTVLPVITQENIDSVYESTFEITDQSGITGNPDDYFPAKQLDQLFNNPA